MLFQAGLVEQEYEIRHRKLDKNPLLSFFFENCKKSISRHFGFKALIVSGIKNEFLNSALKNGYFGGSRSMNCCILFNYSLSLIQHKQRTQIQKVKQKSKSHVYHRILR